MGNEMGLDGMGLYGIGWDGISSVSATICVASCTSGSLCSTSTVTFRSSWCDNTKMGWDGMRWDGMT